MDAMVLWLQCGKGTAVFVPSKDRDTIADVWTCGSKGLDYIFPVLYRSNNLLLYEQVRWRLRFFFFSFSRVRETSIRYEMITYSYVCNVVFVVFWGTLFRPITAAVVSVPNPTTCKTFLVGVHAYRKSPGRFCPVFQRDICPEDSLIRRRNYLTTETLNSRRGPGRILSPI